MPFCPTRFSYQMMFVSFNSNRQYHQWSRNWLPFRRNWVGVVLLNLYTRTRYVSICRYYNSILIYFMIYHRIFNSSNMTTSTSGEGTAYLCRTNEFTPGFACFALLNLCFFYVKIIVHLFFFPKPLYCLSLFDLHFWLLLWYFQTLLEFEHINGYIDIHFKYKECAAI
jgi:hypothetical protein